MAIQTNTQHCHMQTKSNNLVSNCYQRTTCQLKRRPYTILYDGFIPNQFVSIIIWLWCKWSCDWFEMKPLCHHCGDQKSSVPCGSTAAVRWLKIQSSFANSLTLQHISYTKITCHFLALIEFQTYIKHSKQCNKILT